jgi:hypothetical protein
VLFNSNTAPASRPFRFDMRYLEGLYFLVLLVRRRCFDDDDKDESARTLEPIEKLPPVIGFTDLLGVFLWLPPFVKDGPGWSLL